MIISIGSDHAGYEYKEIIKKHLIDKGYEVLDAGAFGKDSVHYPEFAIKAAEAVRDGKASFGFVVCSSGEGVSMAANKVKGIRAALCHDVFSAQATRKHNDANILAMGARVVGEGLALKIVDTFLNTEFSNEERHIERIHQIED